LALLPADVRPRLCHIRRDKNGFGFSVSGPEGTKGLFQLSVRHGGPADRAGVPTGSWLLELNGASVRSCSRAQLARKVGSKMTLLVASGTVEEFYRLRGLQVPAAAADASWLPYKARELHMVKGPGGYGFLLKEDDYGHLLSPVPAAAGQFLWEVDAGLAAERAGMREGDRVLAVNGESIEGLDHQQTVLRIRAHEDRVTLLVIDPASDEFYRVGHTPLEQRRGGPRPSPLSAPSRLGSAGPRPKSIPQPRSHSSLVAPWGWGREGDAPRSQPEASPAPRSLPALALPSGTPQLCPGERGWILTLFY
uniref:NHERF family PDZ scaffold protein 4 n=1 Tax=Anas platyrhynchos platyrhynchos TaxID=8840 RepID=A0A493T159_ANAPP